MILDGQNKKGTQWVNWIINQNLVSNTETKNTGVN